MLDIPSLGHTLAQTTQQYLKASVPLCENGGEVTNAFNVKFSQPKRAISEGNPVFAFRVVKESNVSEQDWAAYTDKLSAKLKNYFGDCIKFEQSEANETDLYTHIKITDADKIWKGVEKLEKDTANLRFARIFALDSMEAIEAELVSLSNSMHYDPTYLFDKELYKYVKALADQTRPLDEKLLPPSAPTTLVEDRGYQSYLLQKANLQKA